MVCDTRIFIHLYPGAFETSLEWIKGASVDIDGVLSSYACGVAYLNGVDVHITIDVGDVRVVDNIQTTYMDFRRYSIPANYEYKWIVPSTVLINGVLKDTTGMPITINVSFAGNDQYNPSSAIHTARVAGILLGANKASAKTGESITFIGSWIPDSEFNIYYWTKDPYTRLIDWREHIIKTKTDANGDFKTIAILPLDAKDSQGNTIVGSTVLEFQACLPGYWPSECSGTTTSIRVPITISPGGLIPTPGKYVKTYPIANTYSGPASSETMHISAFKYIDIGEGKPISLEEARVNILMLIENTALQQGVTLLEFDTSYSEGTLYYEFDVKHTYITPAGAVGMSIPIMSLAIPVIYLAIGAVILIMALLLIFGPPEVKDFIWKGVGTAVTGALLLVGIAAAAIFILPRITPMLKKVTAPKREVGT